MKRAIAWWKRRLCYWLGHEWTYFASSCESGKFCTRCDFTVYR